MARMYYAMKLLVLFFILFIKSNWSYEVESMAGILGENNILKITKRHDDIGYLKQCGVLNSWHEKSERMQVLAFLDASWSSSHTQAVMLKELKDRLERSNVSGIDFFAINAAFALVSSTEKSPLENYEWDGFEETAQIEGREISIYEMLTEDLANLTGTDIKFIQDTPELGIWNKLKVSRDQILVIDKCGRLTYQVIVPWSILQFAYVKAAILSTYKDQPCGSCDAVLTSAEITKTPDTNKHRIHNLNINPISLEENQNTSKNIKLLNDNASDEKIINDSITENQLTTQYSVNDLSPATVPSIRIFENENSEFTDNKSVEITTTISSIVDHPESKNEYDTTTEYYVPRTTEVYIENVNAANTDYENNVKHVTESIAVTEIDDGNIKNVANSQSVYDDTNNFEQRIRTDPMNIVVSLNMDDIGHVYEDDAHNQKSQLSRTSVQSTEETIVDTQNEDLVPLRIIMHAPHLHENDHSTERHEYLVLKVGQPDYHEHLGSGEIVKNIDDLKDFPIEEINMENLLNNATKEFHYEVDDNGKESKGTALSDESIKKHTKHGKYHDKGQKLSGLLFGKDESPGFYGEDLDYWRNNNSEQSYERVEITLPNENQEYFKVKDDVKPMNQDSENLRMHENNKDITIDHEDQSHDIDNSEEETRNKLIAHYSKLLPWIYYVLDK